MSYYLIRSHWADPISKNIPPPSCTVNCSNGSKQCFDYHILRSLWSVTIFNEIIPPPPSTQFQKIAPPRYHPNYSIFDYYTIRSHWLVTTYNAKKSPGHTLSIIVRPLADYLIIIFLCHYGQLLIAKIIPPPPSCVSSYSSIIWLLDY